METSRQQLIEHLHALGISRGTDLVVHARLISFGKVEGGVEGVVDALREVVGPVGTIAMPSFTLHLREADVFDRAQTVPEDVGVLARHFRLLPETQRSKCPMHSYAAIGPKASAIAASDETQSMGKGSTFETLRKRGFAMLMLGCSIHQGATQVHQVEADVGVPYREWIQLPRSVRDGDGRVRRIEVHYYGRRKDSGVTLDLAPLERELLEQGATKRVALPYGHSHLLEVTAFHEVASAMLRKDPNAFVAHP